MKKIEFQQIGDYSIDSGSSRTKITIKRDLKDALIRLDHFSHCVIFTKEKQGFHCNIAKIVNISEKTGEVLIESDNQLTGELIDIKPFFPCEEKADGYDKDLALLEEDFEPLLFSGMPIGKFFNSHDGGIIQFCECENTPEEAITGAIKNIKEGSFLRVIWWFDRFDDKRFRSHLVCNPPYENAPKCGVFATRSPVRPNPLASTIVKVKSAEPYSRSISVLGFDGFDNSMILQVIPYQEIDISGIEVPEWVAHWTDRKVFNDIPGMDLYSDADKNAAYADFTGYYEELDSDEIFEHENSDSNEIVIEGASIHNLQNINVKIPKEKITVITGVSGSGKSSLAFDTIYRESQKQFLDLIASNALTGTELKDSGVKKITGLQPSIAIEQKGLGSNPRSTVASVTKIGDYLRLLFATIGERICPYCNEAVPRLLAENRSSGSTEGIDRFFVNKKCSRCNGERLLEEGRLVRIGSTRYPEATKMSITMLKNWCHFIYGNMNEINREKCRDILKKIIVKIKKIEQVGLGYINLDRSIPSLSGGEAQRLKIANQFGSWLSNILYVMDEPSKGLHPKDFQFLIEAIQDLKKMKNTVIIVEHKKELIQMADYLIEIGPGAGKYGGQLLSAGTVEHCTAYETDDYEYDLKSAVIEENAKIVLKGAKTNNLKNIDVSIPINKLVCVMGVSGSGKSSLVSKTLYPAIVKALGGRAYAVGEYDGISGTECISEIYYVSQKAIGKNSRSTPGTYTGIFEFIRDYYASLDEAKKAKLSKEHFCFNSAKGQCEACKGTGEIAIPMYFMQDLYVPCEKCKGKRYKESVLKIKHKGYSISDLLDLEIREVKELFINDSGIYQALDMLCKVGLSYIKLGQNATTLSGGEAQRVRLAKEICFGKTEGAVYILDEPTSGLHDNDVDKLYYIIRELISKGATVVVTEHNPRIIRQADYIIELGPEGGEKGGFLLREEWRDS